eukprot:6183269-Pleurochrysis_carterae.AAC.2
MPLAPRRLSWPSTATTPPCPPRRRSRARPPTECGRRARSYARTNLADCIRLRFALSNGQESQESSS